MSHSSPLLQPLRVGPLTLKNRIMFPPMTTGYEERDGSISPRSLHFYERLARGGTGYVVLGDVAPVNTATPIPRLCSDEQIPSFRLLADTLHRYDCKVALQIFHPEYDAAMVTEKLRRIGPLMAAANAAKERGDLAEYEARMSERRALGQELNVLLGHGDDSFANTATHEQLHTILRAMAEGARRAAAAGIDAIEVHGDRLLGSLCSTLLNQRTDCYGGSFENRVRYALETVAAIREAAPGLMIEYKLPLVTVNADGSLRGRGGLLEEEAMAFAQLLERAGVHMLQAAQANHTSNMGDTIPPMGTTPYNWTLPITARIKQAVSIPVATVGRVITVESGEEILRSGQADVIGYGRSLLADPDIAVKAERDESVRLCLNCNLGCVDALHDRRYISCVLNAENGDEETIFIRPGEGHKRVAIAGAGIAGLEAARVAALRGYAVTVYEATDRMGGQLKLACLPPRKDELRRAVEYYEKLLPTLGVTIQYNTPCTAELLNAADAAIIAIGAHEKQLDFPGADRKNVVNAWDVLSGKQTVSGHCVVVGGGLVGTETAEFLLARGCRVSAMKRSDRLAGGISATLVGTVLADFEKGGLTQHLHTRITGVTEEGVQAVDLGTGESVFVPCDWVVMAVGAEKNEWNGGALTVPVQFVGDCSGDAPADIASAIRSAYRAANRI